jgi:deoxyribodipyrimidine photolyase
MAGLAIHWFRNEALYEAARADGLLPLFVLDPALLRASRRAAPRVRFLLDCLERLARELELRGSRLVLRTRPGSPAGASPRPGAVCARFSRGPRRASPASRPRCTSTRARAS